MLAWLGVWDICDICDDNDRIRDEVPVEAVVLLWLILDVIDASILPLTFLSFTRSRIVTRYKWSILHCLFYVIASRWVVHIRTWLLIII